MLSRVASQLKTIKNTYEKKKMKHESQKTEIKDFEKGKTKKVKLYKDPTIISLSPNLN